MNDTAQTLLRSVLKVAGGYAVAKGLTDESTSQTIIGALVALAGIFWGVLHRTPDKPQPVPINKIPLALAIVSILALGSGCASQAIMRGNIVTVKERMFGLIVSESPANQTPQVKLGFNSVVVQFIPTSTNGPIYAPPYADTFDLKQGLNPFGTGISENTGTGNVMTGTNGETSVVVPK